jgi:hypothetical protein
MGKAKDLSARLRSNNNQQQILIVEVKFYDTTLEIILRAWPCPHGLYSSWNGQNTTFHLHQHEGYNTKQETRSSGIYSFWTLKNSIFWDMTPCSPVAGGNDSFHAGFLLGLFFYLEDVPDMFIRNVGWLSIDYTGCFTTLGHNCRRWFPRSLWSTKFI